MTDTPGITQYQYRFPVPAGGACIIVFKPGGAFSEPLATAIKASFNALIDQALIASSVKEDDSSPSFDFGANNEKS